MSAPQRLRIGIAGAGIGLEHIKAYRSLPQLFSVAAVCDKDAQRARMAADLAGAARIEASADALIEDAEIDVVDVCLPPQLHFPLARRTLEAGKHAICEKPLTLALAEADKLLELHSKGPGTLHPVFQYRCALGFRTLMHIVGLGLAGRPLAGALETHWRREDSYFADAPWRGQSRLAGGGALLSHAIHIHDMLCCAFGAPAAVLAYPLVGRAGIDVEDHAAVAFRFAEGAVATSSVSLGSAQEGSRMRLIFERMTATSVDAPALDGGQWLFEAADPADQPAIDAACASVQAAPGWLEGFLLGVHASICDGREPNVTAQAGRLSIELITAIYHSARTGESARLPLGSDHELYQGWLQ